MTTADLLRLVAVPVLGWAAYRDVETRRVPTRTWYPLVALGVVLLAWDARRVLGTASPAASPRLFLLRVGISLGVVVPFAYVVWWIGGFGGADAKALMALAVLFPTYPSYPLYELGVGGGLPGVLPTPAGRTALGVFSLTVLTNTVLVGAASPVGLTLRNLAAGELSRAAVVGRRVPVASLAERHGSLLETPDGFTRDGLDLDALRMYLRWRGATLEELLADPDGFRDPAGVPDERFEPGDGAVDAGPGAPLSRGDRGRTARGGNADAGPDTATGARPPDDEAGVAEGSDAAADGAGPDPDEWGAAGFLTDAGWDAYGTDPDDLRAGLELLAEREAVWYSPGIPFVVPMFLGLVVALTYGDLLFGLLDALGVIGGG